MAKKYDIRIQKTVLNKGDFDRAVDTSFKTFVDAPSDLDEITIPEFFNLYEKLYYDIPVDGEVNSHEFLVIESGKLVNLEQDTTEFFSAPNFNVDLGEGVGSSGDFETWTSLLDAGSPTQQKIIDRFFSGSLGEIKLNIDYSDFKNFINFSSAQERVENFYFKLQ